MTNRQKKGDNPIENAYYEMCDRCDAIARDFERATEADDTEMAVYFANNLKAIGAEWGIGIQIVRRDEEDD